MFLEVNDGLFNLGSALVVIQALPTCVNIVMNGKYFNYDKVRKNAITGEFENLNI